MRVLLDTNIVLDFVFIRFQNFFLILVFIFSFQIAFSQEKPTPLLVESVGQISCEDLLSRLDMFAVNVNTNPDSAVYVVIHGGSNPIDNNFYRAFIESYSLNRGLDKTRFVVLTTGSGEDFKIEFWSSKKNVKPEINEEKFSYLLPKDTVKYHFAGQSFLIENIEGESTLVGDCPACCIQDVDFGLLKNVLEANPHLNAQIVIYNKTNRKQFNRFVKLIFGTTKELGIERSRLKIIYGGKKEGIYVWSENMASLNVSLILNKNRKNKIAKTL